MTLSLNDRYALAKGLQPSALATAASQSKTNDLILKISQEFQDRSRKDIDKWRNALKLAENTDDSRWYAIQDLYDDLILDAHLASVIDLRKASTLNHRFYVTDISSGTQLDEQNKMLDKAWFYEFIEHALDAIFKKYTVLQVFNNKGIISVQHIPRRNVCPQLKRMYLEVAGNKYIDYSLEPSVIEILHSSKFGLINDVAPNVIWKRNALQSYAEFTERFGMPLITATTANKQDVPRIESGLKSLGEAGTGVLPKGSEITVHDLANAGNPEKTYIENAKFQDNQTSKRMVGSTTMVDEGANRAQTQVHADTLDDKISLSDKRMIAFVVNDKLFPLLQKLGLPFDNTKMRFQFDETEDLTLSEQWKITSDALQYYELDDEEVKKTFNLPIIGKKAKAPTDPNANFNMATALGAIAVACAVRLPIYQTSNTPTAQGFDPELMNELSNFDNLIHQLLWSGNTSEVEKQRLLKGKRIAEELRGGLFDGWSDRRMEVSWNAPDHRALSMMEMNLFKFANAKSSAEVLMLNRLLIDKDKLEIRSESDFIKQAKAINSTFNERYLRTERNFAIATGQNSARWFEFMGEKGIIGNWRYQTIGDNHVRDEHEKLDGRVFSFDDVQARRLWPPNGYECRCEGLQEPQATNVENGKEWIDIVFPDKKQKAMFAINRADTGVVFTQNQMYLSSLEGNTKELNKYSYSDYGLKPLAELQKELKPISLDKTITPDNIRELFKNNAGTKGFDAMGYDDYLGRKLILKEIDFTKHLKGDYVGDIKNRHQLFPFIEDVLKNPSEVYLRTYNKTKEQVRYLKFYNNESVIVDCEITPDGLSVKTWYFDKAGDKNATRGGLLIK